MKISVRNQGNAKIVLVEGDVDLNSSKDLRKALFDALRESPRLIVNLGSIRYIDSSGIATLIEALRESKNTNKELALCAMSGAVLDVFKLTHVIKIFQVYETEEQALSGAQA
jgi:anti-sigma B factor antagonist